MKIKHKSKNKFGLNREDFDTHEDYLKEYKRLYSQSEVGKEKERRYEKSDSRKAAKKKHRQTDRGKAVSRALAAKRRATKIMATPSWANLEKIKEIYKNCPEGYHVDHIYPLKSEYVCGLHVENNLQYLTAAENCGKGNKFELYLI